MLQQTIVQHKVSPYVRMAYCSTLCITTCYKSLYSHMLERPSVQHYVLPRATPAYCLT